jgi:hypothetical protein
MAGIFWITGRRIKLAAERESSSALQAQDEEEKKA